MFRVIEICTLILFCIEYILQIVTADFLYPEVPPHLYAVEHDVQPEVFQNAFSGMWWSMSTLLTIGYGDIYPITIVGRIMAILISFLGVGLVAIPTGIISAGFVEQYQYRTHIGRKLVDIKDIGEIKIGKAHPFAGRTLAEIEADKTLKILLVIRKELKLIPSDSLC